MKYMHVFIGLLLLASSTYKLVTANPLGSVSNLTVVTVVLGMGHLILGRLEGLEESR